MACKRHVLLNLSKITVATIAFAVSAFEAIILLPRVFRIPFGKTSFRDFARRIGFYLPKDGWKHIGLGLILAACTLSGMLVGSILTGEYVLDTANITLGHQHLTGLLVRRTMKTPANRLARTAGRQHPAESTG
jgi:hypothetical protein